VVGLVRSARGLKGDVRIEVLTDRPADRFRVGAILHREAATEPLTIQRAEPVADGPGWWLRFAEIADRSAADALRGVYLEADVSVDERPSQGVWWHEVIGATVSDRDGRDLGRVVDVYRAGGAEVYVVEGPIGRFDVPGVRAVVVDWRPREGSIIIDRDALGLERTDPA
jgi:16S rRNA processing protein RimM